ncbi:MAG: dihydropteroate synthase [Armatimonadetes bacterium]|nr:dihydropteroate synthase [Armatimonadota bacterium]
MGIVNVTPDSFSGDGLWRDDRGLDDAVAFGERLVAEGADLLDVGGESSRPGAAEVPIDEERRRVIPLIDCLSRRVPVPISVDTTKAAVAREALDAGAVMINDISALRFDDRMAATAAAAGCAVVLLHMQGTPATMQVRPEYGDVVAEVRAFLAERVAIAVEAGVAPDRILVDPGFGFGKRIEHNLEIVRRLGDLRALGCPLLLGPSRKATIGAVLGGAPPGERLEGTIALVALAVAHGVDVVRVHDVGAAVRAVRVADAVVRGSSEGDHE